MPSIFASDGSHSTEDYQGVRVCISPNSIKVCLLTSLDTIFGVDAAVRQNHRILQNILRVRIFFARLIKLTKHSLLNSPYNPLAICLAGFSAKSRTRKCDSNIYLFKVQGTKYNSNQWTNKITESLPHWIFFAYTITIYYITIAESTTLPKINKKN